MMKGATEADRSIRDMLQKTGPADINHCNDNNENQNENEGETTNMELRAISQGFSKVKRLLQLTLDECTLLQEEGFVIHSLANHIFAKKWPHHLRNSRYFAIHNKNEQICQSQKKSTPSNFPQKEHISKEDRPSMFKTTTVKSSAKSKLHSETINGQQQKDQ